MRVYVYCYSEESVSQLLASFKGYTVNAIEGSYSVTLIRNRYCKDKSFYGMSRLFLTAIMFSINTQRRFFIDARSSQRVYAHCTQGNPSFLRFAVFIFLSFLFLYFWLKRNQRKRNVQIVVYAAIRYLFSFVLSFVF